VDGWGYKLLMFLCVALATIFIAALTSRGGSSGGGSFGGGFSGGGGATGSW
jgi:uncharacterized protein